METCHGNRLGSFHTLYDDYVDGNFVNVTHCMKSGFELGASPTMDLAVCIHII